MAAPVTIVDANGHANSSSAPQYIATPTPAAVKAGQYKLTASAASITGGTAVTLANGVTATSDGTGNGFILESGESVYLAVANLASVFAIGTSNDVLTWVGN